MGRDNGVVLCLLSRKSGNCYMELWCFVSRRGSVEFTTTTIIFFIIPLVSIMNMQEPNSYFRGETDMWVDIPTTFTS